MVNGPEGGLEWDAVNWRTHEKNVARLRQPDLHGGAGR